MTEYDQQMKSMTADDVLGDVLVNSEAFDGVWEMIINSDEIQKTVMKMVAESNDLNVYFSKSPLEHITENARLCDAFVYQVRTELSQQIEDMK